MRRKIDLILFLVFVVLLFAACAPLASPIEEPAVVIPSNPPDPPAVEPIIEEPPALEPTTDPAGSEDPPTTEPSVSPPTSVDPPLLVDPPVIEQPPQPETWSTFELLEEISLQTDSGAVIIRTPEDLKRYEESIKKIIEKAEQNEQHKFDEHEWVLTGYSERHPHYLEYKCACGATFHNGETTSYEMKIVGVSSEHPHYMEEECSICGNRYENTSMPTTLRWILHGYTVDHPHYMITKCSQCDYTKTNTNVTALENGACKLISDHAAAEHPHNFIITCTYEGCTYSTTDNTHTAEWEIESDSENYTIAHPHYLYGMCSYDGCGHVEKTGELADWTWDDGVCSICGGHKDLLYETTPTGKRITGVQEGFNQEHYEIPQTIQGEPVTEIGQHAFAGNQVLRSVVIPNSVQLIEHGAFMDCHALTSVVIAESVHMIEDSAFANCMNLMEVEILAPFAPAIVADIFAGSHPELIIYVPEGAEGYEAGTWEQYHIIRR